MSKKPDHATQILDAVKAHRPGVEVEILSAEDNKGEAITVRVFDVPLKHMRTFATEIGLLLPEIINVVGDIMKTDVEGGKVTAEDIKKDPSILEGVLKRPGTIGKLLPMLLNRLASLIDACVDPEGVFLELPHDLSADIVRAWLDLNLLQEGKVQRWAKAFEGMGASLDTLLPSGSQSQPSSAPDSE